MSTWLLRIRRWHGRLAPIVLLPLLITVSTGLGYRLMQIHEGEWLGAHGETIYVLLNGLGLIWMLSTGLVMLLGKWLR